MVQALTSDLLSRHANTIYNIYIYASYTCSYSSNLKAIATMALMLKTLFFSCNFITIAWAYSVSSIVSRQLFNSIFLHKDDAACPAKDFYTYESFVRATRCFPRFGSTGSLTTRKREVAAFLAQISHETTGGWATAPDGPYAWGLCFKEEISPQSDYCDSTSSQWPCFPGKSYHGRGPIQLSWNYNYGPAGRALGFDGLQNPEMVSNNSVIA